MGGKTSKDALKGARRRASLRAGALQVSGRYHHFPRKLEDDYILSETVLGCGGGFGRTIHIETFYIVHIPTVYSTT